MKAHRLTGPVFGAAMAALPLGAIAATGAVPVGTAIGAAVGPSAIPATAPRPQSIEPPRVTGPLDAAEPQVAAFLEEMRSEAAVHREDPAAWQAYGEALHAHGHLREAAASYREAIRLGRTGAAADPAVLESGYLLAHALRNEAPSEALEAAEAAVAVGPGYAPAWILLGEIRGAGADSEGAGAAFRRALELEPDNPLALLRLGSLEIEAGRAPEALALLWRAAPRDGGAGSAAVHAALARAYATVGDRERAASAADLAAKGSPAPPAIEDPIHHRMTGRNVASTSLLQAARLVASTGSPFEAEARYRELLGVRPADPVVLAELGAVLDRGGRGFEAEKLWADAIALDPDQPLARYGLGARRAAASDWAGAAFHFERSLATRPDHPATLAALGAARFRLGEIDEAATSFEACVRIAPWDGDCVAALGELRLGQNRFEEAARILGDAGRLLPEDGGVRLKLAAALAELGRYADAWARVREARRLGVEAPEGFLALLREKMPEPP